MGVVSAIVAAVAKITFGAVVKFVAGTILSIGVSRLMAKRAMKKANAGGDGGARVQLPPATDNKLPIVYGSAFVSGPITDAKISTDQKTMWYVVALAEHSDNQGGGGGSYTFDMDNIFYDGKKVNFASLSSPQVINLQVNNQGTIQYDTRVNGKLFVYLFTNGSSSGVNTFGQTAIQILQDSQIPIGQRWTSDHLMSNTCFAIVKVVYNTDAGTTGLGAIACKITNSLTKPGDCIKDYLLNDRYGCAIPLNRIDTDSLDDLNDYSDELIEYIPADGDTTPPLPTQSRYRINGPLDTANDCLTNTQILVDACDSWLQYSELTGRWKVVINKKYDEAPDSQTLNDLFLVDSSNLVGGITLNPIDLNETYNQVEVAYPNFNIKDQTDFQVIELEDYQAGLLSPNEAINRLNMQLPVVNNAVQAKYLAVRRLLQSREDLVIVFRTDYSGIQVLAGDVIRITHPVYGWTNKLFRVSNVAEEKYSDGSLGAQLVAFEYNGTIYDDNAIQDFVPEYNTGLTDPNIISQPGTPVAVNNPDETGVISSFKITSAVPESGTILYMDFNYGNTSNVEQHVLYRTLQSAGSGPFTNSGNISGNVNVNNLSIDINDLVAGTYYFSVTARNDFAGTVSNASASFVWAGAGINAANIIDANGVFSSGNILTSNNAIPNLAVNANVYLVSGTGQLANNTYITVINSTSPANFEVTPTPIIALANAEIQVIKGGINGNAIVPNTMPGNRVTPNTLPGNTIIANTVNGNVLIGNTVNGNVIIGNSINGNAIIGNTLNGNVLIGNSVNGNVLIGNSVNGNVIIGNSVNGNVMIANTLNGNSIIANTINGNTIIANTLNGNRITANTLNGNTIIANTINGNTIIANTLDGNTIKANTLNGDTVIANTLNGNRITANTLNGNTVIANTLNGNTITANTLNGNTVIANTLNGNTITANTLNGNRIIANTIDGNTIIANTLNGNTVIANTLSGNTIKANTIDGNTIIANTLSGNTIITDTLDGNTIKANTLNGNSITANTVNGNRIIANTLNGNTVIANTLNGNTITANTLNGNTIIANTLDGNSIIAGTVTGIVISANTLNGNTIIANTLNGNTVIANTLNGNTVIANTLNGNTITANTLNGNSIIANTIDGNTIIANTLNGNSIQANTMNGNRIVANTLNGNTIIANTLNGNSIVANTMSGNVIIANTLNGNTITANTLNGNTIISNTVNGNVFIANTINGNSIQTNTLNGNTVIANTLNGNSIQAFSLNGGVAFIAGTIQAQAIAANTITFENLAIGAVTQSKSTISDPIVQPVPFTNVSNAWPDNTRCVIPSGGVTIIPSTDPQSSANTEYTEGSRIQVSWSVKMYVDDGGANLWSDYNLIEIWKSGASSTYDRGFNTIRQCYDVTGNATSAQNQQLHAYGYSPAGLDLYSSDGGNTWNAYSANVTDKTVAGAFTLTATNFTTYPRSVGTTIVGPYQVRDGLGGLLYTGVGYRSGANLLWNNDQASNSIIYRTSANTANITGYQSSFNSCEFTPHTGGNGYPYNTITGGYIITGNNGDIFFYPSVFSPPQNTTNFAARENVPNLLKDLYASYSNPPASNVYTAVICGQQGTVLRASRGVDQTNYANTWTAKSTFVQGDNTQPVLTDFYAVAGDNTVPTGATSDWVVVGQYGMIQYSSDDGDTWNQVYLGNTVSCDFNAVRYGNGKWIACGDGGNIYISNNAGNANAWTQVDTGNLNYTNGSPYGSIYGTVGGNVNTNARQLNTINYNGEWDTWSIGGQGIILYSDDDGSTWEVAYEEQPSETYDLTRVTYYGSWPSVANVSRPPAEQKILNNQIFSGTILDTGYVAGQETTYYLVIGNMAGKPILAGQIFLQVQEIKR